ncbi:RNA 2'-phosphotransferase [Bacillus thuringiensis]|uniref:RNA 2'-phosphotransferase n=1 Tax=Bacillus thuringiensis TaxID=1428 RepID=UPI0021D68D32|nr:RNA 2'-phosphotransferase [Bacillus thuringiensis]MCU7667228.1 RNA 2'-phosphotransferase [Bacillus thuringiensis]
MRDPLGAFMSKILRHEPEKHGITVDEYGYCKIKDLTRAISKQKRWSSVTEEDIVGIVHASDKKRYEIEGDKVRARYGHSYHVLHPEINRELPEFLFHGTNEHALKKIMDEKEGLKPMNRQDVHLSETRAFADLAAKRRKNPKMVKVNTIMARELGTKFVYAGHEVWLSTEIPCICLEEIPF